MLKDYIDKIVKNLPKDKKVLFTVALGVIGMMIILFSGASDTQANEVNFDMEKKIYDEDKISMQLQNIIEQIDGVGKVSVMITYEEGQETVYAKDEERDRNKDDISENKEYIIIDSKDGETGLQLKIIYPKVKGVAVVCQGAQSNIIKQQIIDLICALFDLSSNKISVAVMSE